MILGSSQILRPSLVYGNLACSRALSNTNPGSLKPDSRDPETETGNLETEKRVHRIHGTLETGLHKDPSQPGGPHKGGRRILLMLMDHEDRTAHSRNDASGCSWLQNGWF